MAIMNSLSQHEDQLRETLADLEQDPSDEHADSNIEALLAKIGGCEDVASKLERSLDDLIAGLDDMLAGLGSGLSSSEAQGQQVEAASGLDNREATEAPTVPPQTADVHVSHLEDSDRSEQPPEQQDDVAETISTFPSNQTPSLSADVSVERGEEVAGSPTSPVGHSQDGQLQVDE